MDESKEITIVDNTSAICTIQDVKQQINIVNELLTEIMKVDHHYGIVPGTKKYTLLKPGAEKLCVLFQLVPKVDKIEKDLGSGHREYEITMSLYHRKNGAFWGQGVGSCSTLESKYRYRKSNTYEDTGLAIPKDAKDKKAEYRKQGYGMVKNESGAWLWVKYKGDSKVENPDIADVYNTVLKMAYKRALVSATIQATGVSDIFTQDMDDFIEEVEHVEVKNPFDDSALPMKSDLETEIDAIITTINGKASIAALNTYRNEIRERVKNKQIKGITKDNFKSIADRLAKAFDDRQFQLSGGTQ